jgi:hypothetical protein
METILTVKEESMIAVADAVREKSGSTESLSFPNGMVAAINSIETTPVDLTGYATEEYVNDAISNIDFPEPDLTGYATETYVDEAIAAVGGGASDAASVSFDDTAAQIGATTVQAAIEYLADEAVSSTSVQEQIDTTFYNSSRYIIPTYGGTHASIYDASEYGFTDKGTCKAFTSNTRAVLHWDIDDMKIRGVYTNNYYTFNNEDYLYYEMKKGHYYSVMRLERTYFKEVCEEISAFYTCKDLFGIMYNNGNTWSVPVGNKPCAVYVNSDFCYVLTDITYVYADAASGGGASDASAVSFNDEVAQIGATTVQEAIEYLADEAASSTSVQEQIDENNIDLLKDINIKTSGFDITATPKNASAYVWENNSCPWSFNEKVIYWDMDNMDIHGAYTDPNSNYDIKKMDYGKSTFKKGHYYSCQSVGAVDMRTFAGKYGDRNLQLYYGISTSASLKTSPITDSSVCLWYGRDYICYAFKDITHLLLADKVVSEDRVSEMITEALGVIENGTY